MYYIILYYSISKQNNNVTQRTNHTHTHICIHSILIYSRTHYIKPNLATNKHSLLLRIPQNNLHALYIKTDI
jgi:hypothetical protein